MAPIPGRAFSKTRTNVGDTVLSMAAKGRNSQGNEQGGTATADTFSDRIHCDDILRALMYGKAPRPNAATVSTPLSDTNLLHAVDRITQQIIAAIVTAQSKGDIGGGAMRGDAIRLPHTTKPFILQRKWSMPLLRRLRKQYQKIAAMHPPASAADAANTFCVYLNTNATS